MLAHGQQGAVWACQQIGNQARDLLKDFDSAALAAFTKRPEGGLARCDARTILAAAQAARLTLPGCVGPLTKAAATSTATSIGCETSSAGPTCTNPALEAAMGHPADGAVAPVQRRLRRHRRTGRGGDRPF